LNCKIRLAIIKVSGKPEKSLRGSPSGVHRIFLFGMPLTL